MRAIARVELVPELLLQRHVACEHLRGQQPLEQVVVPAVALAAREPEHAGDGVGLEHRAHDVRRHAEPVDLVPAFALEVERRQRPVRADPLEHALGDLALSARTRGEFRLHGARNHGYSLGQDEREALVVRLEDLAPLVELVATTPGRSRRRARAARGRGSGRRRRSGRTAPTPSAGRPRARRPGRPGASARARASGVRRESAVRRRPRPSRAGTLPGAYGGREEPLFGARGRARPEAC